MSTPAEILIGHLRAARADLLSWRVNFEATIQQVDAMIDHYLPDENSAKAPAHGSMSASPAAPLLPNGVRAPTSDDRFNSTPQRDPYFAETLVGFGMDDCWGKTSRSCIRWCLRFGMRCRWLTRS